MTTEESPHAPAHLKKLGAFLRAHRERRRPEDVGLPRTPRRRTPGLRREEVAALSGVGVAWYTWLEQGRVVASKKVLEAVARTLGLDAAAHRHLLALAGHLPPAPRRTPHDEVVSRVQPLLDAWETSPAVLLDCRFDITAWNAAYTAVWSDPALIPRVRRNLMWCLAGLPEIRDGIGEWEPLARAVLAHFRAQTTRLDGDARVAELYGVLRSDFPELAEWWECQGVGDLTARQVRVAVPEVGELRLRYSAFRSVDDPESLVLVQAPVEEADRALVRRLLARPARAGTAGGDGVRADDVVVRLGHQSAVGAPARRAG